MKAEPSSRVGEAVWTAATGTAMASDRRKDVRAALACGPHLGSTAGTGIAIGGGDGLEGGMLADLPRQAALLSTMLQDHAVGMDVCLIGPKGSGKTAVTRRFASALGYDGVTVYCCAMATSASNPLRCSEPFCTPVA